MLIEKRRQGVLRQVSKHLLLVFLVGGVILSSHIHSVRAEEPILLRPPTVDTGCSDWENDYDPFGSGTFHDYWSGVPAI